MPQAFTAAELAACAEREVKQRQHVYPRLVQDKRMKQEFADRQLAMMTAIAADFRARADAEEAKGRLF
jgi:hypothetical protein